MSELFIHGRANNICMNRINESLPCTTVVFFKEKQSKDLERVFYTRQGQYALYKPHKRIPAVYDRGE